jgi:hypothetical protein
MVKSTLSVIPSPLKADLLFQSDLEDLADCEALLARAALKKNKALIKIMVKLKAGAAIEPGRLSFSLCRLRTALARGRRTS